MELCIFTEKLYEHAITCNNACKGSCRISIQQHPFQFTGHLHQINSSLRCSFNFKVSTNSKAIAGNLNTSPIAFDMFLTTLPSSNATINVTISANGVVVTSDFQSSLGALSIINLPGGNTSLLTLTFIESSSPTQFDLDSLTITTLSNG